MFRRLRRFFLRSILRPLTPGLPKAGYPPGTSTPRLDTLSDTNLDRLNRLLSWHAFTVDGKGRRLGNLAWRGNRTEPQAVPDRRIELLDKEFSLADKSVLE